MHEGNSAGMGRPARGPGLVPLLKELFVHHGYMVSEDAQLEGHSGTVYSVPLLAESEGGAVVIGAHEGPEPLTAADVEEFAATVSDVAANRGVLCHAGPCESDAHEAAQGLVLWSRDTLARFVGEAQIAEALGEVGDPLMFDAVPASGTMVAEHVADVLPDEFHVADPGIEQPESAAPDAQTLPDFAAFAEAFTESASSPEEAALDEGSVDVPVETGKKFSPWADMSPTAPPPAAWLPATPAALPPQVVPTPPPAPTPPRVAIPDSPFGMLLAASVQPHLAETPTLAPQPDYSPPSQPAFNPWNAPPSPLQMPPAFAPAAVARTYTRPLLPVRLKPADAHKKVRDRLYSMSSAELVLHPVHLYDYECDLLQEGKLAFDTEDGRVQVHGSDKSTLDIDPDAANPDAQSMLPANHSHQVTERVLRINEDRAAQLALAHVIKKHTRTTDVRVPDENHSLFYTERRKVEPKAEQVRLRPLGVFFRPAWRLHGDNGYVEVDAIDGRELDVALVGSRHGAIVLE